MGTSTSAIRSKIKYIEGKENKVAGAASRLPVGEITPPLDEEAFEVPHMLF